MRTCAAEDSSVRVCTLSLQITVNESLHFMTLFTAPFYTFTCVDSQFVLCDRPSLSTIGYHRQLCMSQGLLSPVLHFITQSLRQYEQKVAGRHSDGLHARFQLLTAVPMNVRISWGVRRSKETLFLACLTLKVEALRYLETWVTIYCYTRRNIPEEWTL